MMATASHTAAQHYVRPPPVGKLQFSKTASWTMRQMLHASLPGINAKCNNYWLRGLIKTESRRYRCARITCVSIYLIYQQPTSDCAACLL